MMASFRQRRDSIDALIRGALKHARKSGRKIDKIELHPSRWMFFEMEMKEKFPEKLNEKFEAIEFKHYTIAKGSKFMTDIMAIHYKQPVANG
jgi:hypothetical protein